MAVEYERVFWIDGKVSINPWKQPDMELRLKLSDRPAGPDGKAYLTLEEAMGIIGNHDPKLVRSIVKDIGAFFPIENEKWKAPVKWSFAPKELLPVGGNGHGEPHEGPRR